MRLYDRHSHVIAAYDLHNWIIESCNITPIFFIIKYTMNAPVTSPDVMQSVKTLLARSDRLCRAFSACRAADVRGGINYATYRSSNYNWMLGRFIVIAARLDEFYETASEFISLEMAANAMASAVSSLAKT